MPDGEKKILKCMNCQVSYNVAKLKPGTKFKCQKCGTINVVMGDAPTVAAPPVVQSKPPVVSVPPPAPKVTAPAPAPAQEKPSVAAEPKKEPVQVAPPPPQPVTESAPAPAVRPSKIGVKAKPIAANRFSKMGKYSSKVSRVSKKKSTEEGGDEGFGEGEGEDVVITNKKKSPILFIVIGAVVVVIVLILIIVLGGKNNDKNKEKGKKKKTETEESNPNEIKETPKPKKEDPLKELKKADNAIKEQVKGILDAMKDAPNMSEASKLKMDIVNIGEDGITALIEIYFDDPSGPLAKNITERLKELVGQEPDSRKPKKDIEVAEWFKMFWPNKEKFKPGYKFPPDSVVESLKKGMEEAPVAAGTGPATSIKMKGDFKKLYDESLSPQVESVLKQCADREIEPDEAIEKLKNIDKKKLIPVLIIQIANDDAYIGQSASQVLKKITRNMDSREYSMMNEGEKFDICAEWQDWWLKNKDK